MKIPGYEKFDAWASKLYKNTALKTLRKNYSKAQDAVTLADETILETAKKSGLDKSKLSRLKELMGKRKKSSE